MKAIQINEAHPDLEVAIQNLQVVEKPTPKPGPNQVLVRIEAAPCNPSDLLFLQGLYGVKKPFPAVPGWEGAGTVVESGGGAMGWWLKGKRVACGGQTNGDGTWAEYFVAEAKACIPLRDKVSSEQGSCLIINPLTAVAMVEKAVAQGHSAIIQTAACSQVGKMVQTIAHKKQLPIIHIVRRKEQVEELQSVGQKWVLNSAEENFSEKLKETAKKLKATIAFDAIAGKLTGKILHAMPPHSKVLVYGGLSGEFCGEIGPLDLIFAQKTVEGFWLAEWIHKSGFWHIFQATRFVQQLIESGAFHTKIHQIAGFEQWKEALLSYTKEMTAGKVILRPSE